VTGHTGGDDVLPGLAPALGNGNDVVEGEVRRRIARAAILAGVLVTRIDVRARKWHIVERPPYPDATQEANHGRQPEADRHGPHFPVVYGHNLDFPLAPERDRFLPVDDLEGFPRRVEKERLLHKQYRSRDGPHGLFRAMLCAVATQCG